MNDKLNADALMRCFFLQLVRLMVLLQELILIYGEIKAFKM